MKLILLCLPCVLLSLYSRGWKIIFHVRVYICKTYTHTCNFSLINLKYILYLESMSRSDVHSVHNYPSLGVSLPLISTRGRGGSDP